MPLVDNLLSHCHMDRLELIWKADSLLCLMYISTVVVKHVPQVSLKMWLSRSWAGAHPVACQVWLRLRASMSIIIANDYCSQSSDSLDPRLFVRIQYMNTLFTGITAVAASWKEKWAAAKWDEDTNTSDNSAGEEMSFKPDHFLFLWCQTLRHRPAGSHGIICPQQEKPWRYGKWLSPLTMLAGQPKVWTADDCFAEFSFPNCKNTHV